MVGKEGLLSSGSRLPGKIWWAVVPKAVLQAKWKDFRGEGAGKGRGLGAREAGAQAVSDLSTGP